MDKGDAPHSRYVLPARAALGACLAAQQHYAEAEALVDVFTIHRNYFGPDAPRTHQHRARLFDLYTAWGKPKAADNDRIPKQL